MGKNEAKERYQNSHPPPGREVFKKANDELLSKAAGKLSLARKVIES